MSRYKKVKYTVEICKVCDKRYHQITEFINWHMCPNCIEEHKEKSIIGYREFMHPVKHNPIFAMCSRCGKYHKRGSKIFNTHKQYLGMYLDTNTGSRRQSTPKYIRDYWDMRKKHELNPISKKTSFGTILLIVGALIASIHIISKKNNNA